MSQKQPSTYELSKVALKLFIKVSKDWNLTHEQCCKLSGLSEYKLAALKRSINSDDVFELSLDTLNRVSLIISIYVAVNELIGDQQQCKIWVHKKNEQFYGYSALGWMLRGDVSSLNDVATYMRGQRETQYL